MALQRVQDLVAESIGIASPDGSESGIETVGRQRDPIDGQVARQGAPQPPLEFAGHGLGLRQLQIEVGHLAASVDAGVGSPCAHQGWRLVQAQYSGDPGLQFLLDGSQSTLRSPAVKGRTVVAEVKAIARHRRVKYRSRMVRPASIPRRSYLVIGRASKRGAQSG